MEDQVIRRKYNTLVDLSKFTSNKKNIEKSCNLSLQLSLLSNFVQSVIMCQFGNNLFNFLLNFFFFLKNVL